MHDDRNLRKIINLAPNPVEKPAGLIRAGRGDFGHFRGAVGFVQHKDVRECAAYIDTNHKPAHWATSRQAVP